MVLPSLRQQQQQRKPRLLDPRLQFSVSIVLVLLLLFFTIMTPKDVQALSSSSMSSSSSPYDRLRTDIVPGDDENAFTFGVIADVQWADADDGSNYAKTVKRCYRGAFTQLQNAVKYWNSYNSNQDQDAKQKDQLKFIAQLGDLMDGLNQHKPDDESERVTNMALEELNKVSNNCPSVNLVGNHELYNFNRQQLSKASWLQHGNEEYYMFAPAKGWKVIVLDPYQIALIGHAQDDPRRLEAMDVIRKENPNVSLDGADGPNWFDGIDGYQRRFCPYNGGYGQKQLDWFQNQLEIAVANREKVVVLSHVIIHPEACGGGTMAWDYEQALEIMQQHKNNSDGAGVVAVLCGHDHKGNYHCDSKGIHHCTFQSPLNKGEEGYAYGIIKMTQEYIEIRGPKIDDLLPDVEGRPHIGNCLKEKDDGESCESLRFPLRPVSEDSSCQSKIETERQSTIA